MLSAARAIAVGVLAALATLIWGSASVDARATEESMRAWRESTVRWLGPDRAWQADAAAHGLGTRAGRLLAAAGLRVSAIGDPMRARAGLAVTRAASLPLWLPLLAPLWLAALVDGWLARRADASDHAIRPERARAAIQALGGLLVLAPVMLAWPAPMPALIVPGYGLLAAGLLRAWVRHRAGALP